MKTTKEEIQSALKHLEEAMMECHEAEQAEDEAKLRRIRARNNERLAWDKVWEIKTI